jgi:undecaprenyl phosphate N,N'-diacetylbacillosamine 1-phosphate transferase
MNRRSAAIPSSTGIKVSVSGPAVIRREFGPPMGRARFSFLYHVTVGIAAVILGVLPLFVVGSIAEWSLRPWMIVVEGSIICATVATGEFFRLLVYGQYSRSKTVEVYDLHFPNDGASVEERPVRSLPQLIAKRLFDIAFASTALVMLAPMLVVVSILIKLDSPGPILTFSRRVGLHGKVFRLARFRTTTEEPRTSRDRDLTTETTPVGRVLGRLLIDELPQLFNVLSGDMSMVGPRPRYPNDSSSLLHWVKPGLTSLAAVKSSRSMTFADFERLEQHYARSWNLLLDARILIATVSIVLRNAEVHKRTTVADSQE